MQEQIQQIIPQIIQTPPEQLKYILALAIEEKKKRIRENGIRYYESLPSQELFHRCINKIRAIFGGNRSGKTVAGATEAVWYATGTHPYKQIPVPNYGRICCTDFTNGIEKVILPEIRRWMPKNMLKAYNVESRTMELVNGSTIEFMSYDQDVEKFESASRHWIWFDEEPPQPIFNACRMRLLDTKGDIWITMTPTHGMTWVYSDIYEKNGIDPLISIFTLNTYDNPYLDRNSIDGIVSGMDEMEREARTAGTFVQLSGLIYKEFHQDRHELPRFNLPDHLPRVCAIDPHPRVSTVVLYVAVCPIGQFVELCKENGVTLYNEIKGTDDIYIVYDEIYNSEPLLISEVANLMHAKEGNINIGYRLIDTSANTPDPIIGRTIREEFSEKHGIRTILPDKDIANRIFKVRERLQSGTLYFFNDLHNTLWEIKHYAWDDYKIGKDYKDPKEKPRKKRDHAMDCLGYIVASCPQFDIPSVYRPVRSTIDKETGY